MTCLRALRKAKSLAQRLVFFLRFFQVSQRPVCLGHGIQTLESIWYFLIEVCVARSVLLIYKRKKVMVFVCLNTVTQLLGKLSSLTFE